jgi:hypothetical protein
MLERLPRADRRRSAARARETRSRKRRKAGRLVLGIEVAEVELIESLIVAGYLALVDAGDRSRVQAAAQDVFTDFITRWRTR